MTVQQQLHRVFGGVKLRWVLAAATTAVVFVITAAQVLYFPRQQAVQSMAALRTKALTVGELVANNISLSMEFDDAVLANLVVQGTQRDQDVAYLVARKPDGTLLGEPLNPKLAPPVESLPAVNGVAERLDEANRLLSLRFPVNLEDGGRGDVFIGFSTSRLVAERRAQVTKAVQVGAAIVLFGGLAALLLGAAVGRSIQDLTRVAQAVAGGDFLASARIDASCVEVQHLSNAMSSMTSALRGFQEAELKDQWLKTGRMRLLELTREELDVDELCQDAIRFIADYSGSHVAAMYTCDDEALVLSASHARGSGEGMRDRIVLGEGLVGQVAAGQKALLLSELPDDFLRVESGMGSASVAHAAVFPVVRNQEVVAVIELGALTAFEGDLIALLESVSESLAIAIVSARDRQRMRELLAETQRQSGELQTQSDQLQNQNRELERTTADLRRQKLNLAKQQEHLEVAKQGLEDKANELELANKYKTEFLANMSHELRTPLNSLLLLSRDLAENGTGNLSADQVRAASIIHEGGTELLTLINDVLDLSKVEAGKLDLEVRTTTVGEVLEGLGEQFAPLAASRGLELRMECEAPGDMPVVTDAHRVRQVLKNLLSNGLKFTEQGEVVLQTTTTAAGDTGEPAIAFAVIDTGIGIAADRQEVVFDSFRQEDGSTTRRFGGTGLGLAICRELAQLLGGHIDLQSRVGMGSRFTFTLPSAALEMTSAEVSAPEDGHDRTPANVRPSKASLQGRRVLLVDDDLRNTFALARALRDQGMDVVVADNGDLALAKLQTDGPIDAVLMDMMMPVMDGYEATRRIREEAAFAHLPVVAVTANAMEGDRERCLAAGANDYISKPVDVAALLECLDQWMNDAA